MNCNRLKLVLPSNEDKEQVMEYKKIFLVNEEPFDGCAGLNVILTKNGLILTIDYLKNMAKTMYHHLYIWQLE